MKTTCRMTSENTFQKDWYEILGASPSDSLQELKQNYQKLVLMVVEVAGLEGAIEGALYHPDKQSADVPVGELEERVQRFIEVDQAWKILGNEETKREYDLQRREVAMTQNWPVDAQVPLEDMNWIEGSGRLLALRSWSLWMLSTSNESFGVVESEGYSGRGTGLTSATHMIVDAAVNMSFPKKKQKKMCFFSAAILALSA
ncbi:dnaJ homolog subfamily C member 24 isoform X1 [Heterodontus francisci]|uniref:dnaJ homolog subfamily C member 24 isoform X1 n=1 Tax=Heterodontus francisci TaxID=7792 RepID=UPI00355B625A